MPAPHARIQEGIRLERTGALPRALQEYRMVAQSTSDSALLAEAYRRQADVYRAQCKWTDALAAARQSAEIAYTAGLPVLLAEAFNAEAMVHHSRGDFLAAIPLYERMLATTDDERIHGLAHQNLGSVAAARNELDAAERHFLTSHQSFERAAFFRGAVISLINYGGILVDRGDFATAQKIGEQALEAARAVEDRELVGLAMLNYAEALSNGGDLVRAEELASSALGYFSLIGNPLRRMECLRLLGDLRARQDLRDAAQHCYSEALDLAQSIGALHEATRLLDRLQAR